MRRVLSLPVAERQKISPPELARRWGLSPQKILDWIRTGELRAINVSRNRDARKPRFLIDVDAIADFERARAFGDPITRAK